MYIKFRLGVLKKSKHEKRLRDATRDAKKLRKKIVLRVFIAFRVSPEASIRFLQAFFLFYSLFIFFFAAFQFFPTDFCFARYEFRRALVSFFHAIDPIRDPRYRLFLPGGAYWRLLESIMHMRKICLVDAFTDRWHHRPA